MRAEALKGLMLAGLLAGASLAMTAEAGAAPVAMTLQVGAVTTKEEVPLGYQWDREWLLRDSYLYNHGLARICGAVSSTVYLQGKGSLTRLWSDLGGDGSSVRDYHYQRVEPEYKDKCGYSFGLMDLPRGEKLVLVAIRGTEGQQEWLSNLNIADSTRKKGRYHEGFEKAARLVLQDLSAYLQEQGVEPDRSAFLVTGHSRGAAVADLLGAFLDRNEPAADGSVIAAAPSRVYTYTFATPSSCTVIGERRASLYGNIFNIINPEDAVPELPFKGGSWDYNNFGVNFYLPSATKLRGDKERYAQLMGRMSVPFATLTGRQFRPLPDSEDFARAVKNMQWAVGSVERFYKRRGKLGHTNMVNAIKRYMPETGESSGKGFTEMLEEKNSPEELAVANAHSADTYNAWILSGEPQEIYMRGTPTCCRLRVEDEGDRLVELKTLQGNLPLEITLALPGGEEVASYKDGETIQQVHAVNPELKAYIRTAFFTVPEGEKLEVRVKAPTDGREIAFELATTLEANGENGLDKHQRPIAAARKVLKPGETARFLINNRRPKEIRN